jgi:uncharacterized protein YutE (UPF0331/DUF86 family)
MPFDVDKLRRITGVIETNLTLLEQLQPYSFEEFSADFTKVEAAKHLLQVAVQAMIDICSHFVARLRLKVPEDSAGLVKTLSKVGLLPPDHAARYVEMIQFRNLVVHLYAEVDDWQTYDILQKDLGDFRLFIADAWRIVREKGDKTGKAS